MLREIRTFLCIFGGLILAGLGALSMFGQPSMGAGFMLALGVVAVWYGRKIMNGEATKIEEAKLDKKKLTPYSKTDKELNKLLNREYVLPTLALIAINLLVFYWYNVRQGYVMQAVPGDKAIAWGADFAPLTGRGEIWRLFTAQFLHADLSHVVGNMIALAIAGRYVEYYFGRANLFLIYIGGGIFGNMASNITLPTTASLGASGAIFSLYGALLSAMFIGHGKEGKVQLSRWAQYYIAYHTFRGLMSGFQTDGVDNAAHLLGLVAGFAIAYFTYELRWDFSRMAGAVSTALFALVVGMHIGFYPKVPTMKMVQAQIDSGNALKEMVLIAVDLEKQLNALSEATQLLKSGQLTEDDLVTRAWKLEIKPALQMIRNRAYKVKVPDQKTYAIQTDIYQAAAGYERYFTTLYEGTHQDMNRMIASVGPGKFPAKAHFENALRQLEENLPKKKKKKRG